MRAVDGQLFSNVGAANTASFTLDGGQYAIDTVSTGTGSIGLQKLGADGATWIPVYTAVTTTSSFTTVNIPRGTYRMAIATFTANYISICRIQTD